MYKILYRLTIAGLLVPAIGYADCTFRLVNDSGVPVTAEAGFFNAKDVATFTVAAGLAKDVIVKNDKSCNSITKAGLGVTYLNLINGQSRGRWVYDPANSQIKAVGPRANANEAIGITPDGHSVIMLTTTHATDKFTVVIKSAQSSSRQNASMD